MIGDRLAEARKDHNDTQEALAEKLSVSLSTVRSWEQERSSPTHELLVKICRLYDVSADYLLGLSDEDPAFARRRRARFTPEERAELKNVEEYLLWRRRAASRGTPDRRKEP